MSMKTYLGGRLRNTSLPKSHGLSPIFEAVVNSIHSIEEAGLLPVDGRISLKIFRHPQGQLKFSTKMKSHGPEALGSIIGFEILDNGVGFNSANMQSFETLDSDYKADKGCRGVGRLLWLKVFKKISVQSVFEEESSFSSIQFTFDACNGVTINNEERNVKDVVRYTSVHLEGFDENYRDSVFKTADSIANSLFEHCLWYFVRDGGAPAITVLDSGNTIELDNIYENHMHSSTESENIDIKGHSFELTHIKLRSHNAQSHSVSFCAANRLVKQEAISKKVPGLYGKIQDDNGEFIYECYVSSAFLDGNVRPERTGFDISEEHSVLFADLELSFKEIRNAVIERITIHLANYLEENKKLGRERVEKFVSSKAPRYRSVLTRIPKEKLQIDPSISDKELDVTLYKHLAEIEVKHLVDGHEVMTQRLDEDLMDYRTRLNEYMKTASDLKKSDLANYVAHRMVILEILSKAIERQPDGKYVKEEIIHDLIMPMGTDSSEYSPEGFNLWLVDERLAFHDYLASDKPLSSMPVIHTSETKEPDIFALNVFDVPVLVSEGNKLPLASIEIIELKRPLRNDASSGKEKDPIEQSLGYLERIRAGNVQTSAGRPIPNSSNIPGFCYIICDITSSMRKRCKMHDLTMTSDGLGYFGYKKGYEAYVEVISFDRLVNAAKQRNRAFFDKLGMPTK